MTRRANADGARCPTCRRRTLQWFPYLFEWFCIECGHTDHEDPPPGQLMRWDGQPEPPSDPATGRDPCLRVLPPEDA